MKKMLAGLCLTASLILAVCGNGGQTIEAKAISDNREAGAIAEEGETMLPINISIGDRTFPAKLYDNAAARELISRMPMELDMSELHGNEKYYYLPETLPTDSEYPGSIHTGDLMLYGSDCLVLFYEDFQSSFRYTRLGCLEDPAGLSEAVGSGSVTIRFEPAKDAG